MNQEQIYQVINEAPNYGSVGEAVDELETAFEGPDFGKENG